MLKKYLVLIGFALSLSTFLSAQDTLKIMQYNLLYYGKDIYQCNQTNNNRDHKNTQLQTILSYAQPDIFCVNEMDASLADVDYLMSEVLNTDGVTNWSHASVSGSFSINMLYYKSNLFALNSQEYIYASPRQINVYHLTHISTSTDFTVLVAHLKAGSDASAQATRTSAIQNVMNYIENRGPGNYLFMGDFNMYTSTENSFQNLINASNPIYNFYDPINRVGDWHNNSSFSDVHTQATHTSGDCFVGGGMDDRFDFIMISKPIKEGADKLKYLPNSYQTIGQDGSHYNSSVNSGTNNSAPSNVIDALYEMSDHLPVSAKMIFGVSPGATTVFNKTFDNQDINSGGWAQYSVFDETRIWEIPSGNYGHNGTKCAKITGWDYTNNGAVENEDWLISPSFNADELNNETLTFWTAGKYSGADLQVYYSSDYIGTGNPNNADWTQITGFNLSLTGEYVWESSGNIDLSQITGANTRIAFKYTSSAGTGARTWEIDDILLLGVNSEASANQVFKPQSFKIFPNPVKKGQNLILEFETENKSKTSLIQIFDISGKLIKHIRFKSEHNNTVIINTSDIEKGIYTLKLENTIHKLIID